MTVVVPTYKIVVTHHRKSGIARDAVMNTWHYIAPSGAPTSTDFGNWMNEYRNWIDANVAYYCGSLSGTPTGVHVDFTKLTAERPPAGSGLGPPQGSGDLGFTVGPTAAGAPAEVSVCITLDGTSLTDAEEGAGGTRPASRKRNRKYIGPIAAALLGVNATTKEVTLSSVIRPILIQNFVTHMVNAMSARGWHLTTFSPTNWQTTPPHEMWIDDAFDTQRRRGAEPLNKEVAPTPVALQGFIDAHRAAGLNIVRDDMGNLTVVRPLG